MQTFWPSWQRARKEYFCIHCDVYIQPGETYYRWILKTPQQKLEIMREHDSCPFERSNPLDMEAFLPPMREAIVFGLEKRQMLVTYSDGSIGTETKLETVPRTIMVPYDDGPSFEDDVPF